MTTGSIFDCLLDAVWGLEIWMCCELYSADSLATWSDVKQFSSPGLLGDLLAIGLDAKQFPA